MIFFDAIKNENIEIFVEGNETPFLVSAALNAEGFNYYDFQKIIKEKYTCVVSAETGRFRYVNEDPSTIAPSSGERVFGIDELPEDFFSHNYSYWAFDGANVVVYLPTRDELIAAAEAMKSSLMSTASKIIAPLQDAVDLNMATDDEVARLNAWKNYRVLVNRVNTSQPDWPPAPSIPS